MSSVWYFALLFVSVALFVLPACSIFRAGGQTEPSVSSEQLLKEIETANQKLRSMELETQLTLTENQISKTQMMSGQTVYKDPSELIKAHAVLEGKENGYQEVMMPGGGSNPIYVLRSKNGSWEKQTDAAGAYSIYPDYFALLDGLYKLGADLELTEEGDDYVLTLTNQNIDVMSLFGDQFKLNFKGVTQGELKKKLTARFDKKSYFLRRFQLELSYSGDLGSLALKTDTAYSSWNKVDEKKIQAPKEGEKG